MDLIFSRWDSIDQCPGRAKLEALSYWEHKIFPVISDIDLALLSTWMAEIRFRKMIATMLVERHSVDRRKCRKSSRHTRRKDLLKSCQNLCANSHRGIYGVPILNLTVTFYKYLIQLTPVYIWNFGFETVSSDTTAIALIIKKAGTLERIKVAIKVRQTWYTNMVR